MRSKHITVAAQDGPKAGLNAYMESLSGSGLPQVRERHETLLNLSSKKRFAWYCRNFEADITRAKRELGLERAQESRLSRALRRTQATPAPSSDPLADEIAKAEARLAQLREQATQAQATPQRTSPTGGQIRFMERIAKRQGDSVEVTVKLNGRKVTFEQASAYIDAAVKAGVVKVKAEK